LIGIESIFSVWLFRTSFGSTICVFGIVCSLK
jgi:hypothetical protein